MRLWKQLLISLAVIAVGVLLWGRLVPGANGMLQAAGLPEQLVAAIAPGNDASSEGGAQPQRGPFGGGPTLVATKTVDTMLVNDRLSAIGSGEAIRTVTVTPYVAGYLNELLVQSGDQVRQGQVIGRLDNEEQRIAADQARLTRDRASDKLTRYRGLRASSAVSNVEIQDAEAELTAAELALQAAELALRRRDIVAPSDGVIGIILINAGDYVTTTSQITRIDDRSEILVDFWVPERFTTSIRVGDPVSATATARPGEKFSGSVLAIDNRIDEESRTLHVRAKIENPEDVLRAGMSFQVSMHFPGNRLPSVDPLAVQWSAEGSFVWKVNNGKAERIPVSIIQRNPDRVLVNAQLAEGDTVVIEGAQRLRAGGEVEIVGRERPADETRVTEGS
ncbi:MAG: efflux RND transporter periplasmic adaptor subunit [Shinella sp.]|nr:efflux RND transporter periplasmic adaptor subunit [Shinella sp.]